MKKVSLIILFLLNVCFIMLLISCGSLNDVNSTKYLNNHWNQNLDDHKLLYTANDFSTFNGEGVLYTIYEYDTIDKLDILFNSSIDFFTIPKSKVDISFMEYLKDQLDDYKGTNGVKLLIDVPDEYKIDFNNEDYNWYYNSDENYNEMYVLYDKAKSKLYYYIIVW